jgi:hypothetical protein
LWVDENWDGQIDPSDTFLLDYSQGRYLIDPTEIYSPDARSQKTDELIIGIDHELMSDFRGSVSYIYKHNSDIFSRKQNGAFERWSIPYTTTDPGYDGEYGTDDDAQLTLWDADPAIPAEGGFYWENRDDMYRKYQALEFVFEKRMSHKWQLFGSVVFSKMYGTIGGQYNQIYGVFYSNPNQLINADGRSDYDRPIVAKIQATYQMPYGLNLSFYFIASSGSTFTRQVGVNLPSLNSTSVMAETRGSRRYPSWNRLDLRLEKEVMIRGVGRVGLYMDLFNALNSGDITVRATNHGTIQSDGTFNQNSSWLTVQGHTVPRTVQFGLRFTF